MKEEEKLMKLDLQKENKKIEAQQIKGIKLSFFKLIYVLLQNQTDSYFRDIMFIALQFIQLMAFPMDTAFSSGWKAYWYGTFGSIFRYFQFFFLWYENNQFYIISYIVTCVYILVFVILVIYTLHLLNNYVLRSKGIITIILTVIEFESVLNIPLFKILFAVFSCKEGHMKAAPDITCKEGVHIGMIICSVILIIIYFALMILFHKLLFEFGAIHGKLRAAFTSSTEVLLVLSKMALIIIYEFIHNEIIVSILTFLISLYLFIDFSGRQPFINFTIVKFYFTFYLLFLWSSIICLVAWLLKDTEFEGGIMMMLLGIPFIIMAVVTKEMEFTINKVFEYVGDKYKDGYKSLMEIEFFLKLEDSLEDKIKTREQKILYSYINNYERNCTDANCSLKQFLNIKLSIENFPDMKICLLQHAEMLYKNAVSKFPFNAKLRLSYAIFLYKRLAKKQKGTSEILLLSKYDPNLEDSFLIYRAQRFIEEENEGHSDSESNVKTVNSVTYKAILNNIKSLIGKITTHYIDFWTILAISDESKSENFLKMSRIGTKISKFNEDLMSDMERLERVNLYDQDTIKLYSQYLSEILNNHTSANIYNNKLIELEQRKHQFNEENLFDMNYKAMARSEDYKFIVISLSPANFSTISNISLSICTLFGFPKESLIGKSLDYILPELFCIQHKKILKDKVEDFKKTMLLKNKLIAGKVRSEPKFITTFAKSKMKYLIPIKMKLSLVSSEEGNIFGVSKVIIDNHTLVTNEEEIAFILTDRELSAQNFTANAPKLLCLSNSALNNNLDVTDYIKEFKEEFLRVVEEYNDVNGEIQNNKIYRQMKVDILKKMFINEKSSKIITWRLSDVVGNSEQAALNYKNPKFTMKNKKDKDGIKGYFDDKKKGTLNGKPSDLLHKQSSLRGTGKLKKIDSFVGNEKSLHRIGSSSMKDEDNIDINNNTSNNNNNLISKNSKFIKDYSVADIVVKELSSNEEEDIDDNKYLSQTKIEVSPMTKLNKLTYYKPFHHKFVLSVDEAKFGENKIGYIFKFELYCPKKNIESTTNYESTIDDVAKKSQEKLVQPMNSEKENLDMNMSMISLGPGPNKPIVVNKTAENPAGINLGLDNSYIPNIPKENEFTLDLAKMSYQQYMEIDRNKFIDPRERLRKEAMEKMDKVKGLKLAQAEPSSNTSSSSYSSGDEDEEGEDSSPSSGKDGLQSLRKETNDENKNEENNDNIKETDKGKEDNVSQNNRDIKETSAPPSHIEGKSLTKQTSVHTTPKPTSVSGVSVTKVHKPEEDYYHVDTAHITYMVYNYATGFVEVLKDPKFKQSQVTKATQLEKDFFGKISPKFLSLTKGSKRAKSSTKRTEDDIADQSSEKKIKLREIQKALNSKEKQATIVNLCIFSFIIFALIIGSAGVSIGINAYLKNRTSIYYNLIENSVTLYRNLIFEINFARELVILANPMYQNIYDKDRAVYYANFSATCYEYFMDTAFVLSNLSTKINTLSADNKEKIVGVKGELEIIDPLLTIDETYSTKSYELMIYSAFNELNAALYHVTQMNISEITAYEDNVYYFTRNAMNYMMVLAEGQIDNFTNEFYNEVKKGKIVCLICMGVMTIVYLINFFIFVHFYQKVEERKQSYLSVFYEIGSSFIVNSLAKCEKFSQKIQIQDEMVNEGEKISIDSSSLDDSDLENDIGSQSGVKTDSSIKVGKAGKSRNVKNVSHTKTKIGGFIVLFILLLVQLISYYYYYVRVNLYKNFVEYEYYNNKYNSRFLFPFIALREYLYDNKKILLMEEVEKYLSNSLITFYTDLANISDYRDQFTKYLPTSYSEFVDSLYRDEQCHYIEAFLAEHEQEDFHSCQDFFYNTSSYGFQAILTTYIEEIRIMRDLEISMLQEAEVYGFVYNESLYHTKFENKHKRDKNGVPYDNKTLELYDSLNPARILNENTHKTALIVYRFVIMKVVQAALDNLFEAIHLAFDDTIKIGLIINIVFIVVVTIGFTALWLPFIIGENETIYKTKNMLSIIPKEVLITLPHINIMLGIDEDE